MMRVCTTHGSPLTLHVDTEVGRGTLEVTPTWGDLVVVVPQADDDDGKPVAPLEVAVSASAARKALAEIGLRPHVLAFTAKQGSSRGGFSGVPASKRTAGRRSPTPTPKPAKKASPSKASAAKAGDSKAEKAGE